MVIEQISVLNFKNIEQADLTFSPKINCFFGNNGMGKTNLLDALYYLSFTKNHTNLPDSQLILHDKDFAVLQGSYLFEDGRKEEIYCGIRRKQRKIFKRNKKEYEKLSEHVGLLPVVMISPADIELIQGGSEGRRKFVDMVISQQDSSYLHALIRYNKALLQRNFLLKEDKHNIDSSLFDIWDHQLVMAGEEIYRKRKEFMTVFFPIFRHFYEQLNQTNETIKLTYESQLHGADFSGLLFRRRERDQLLGYTSAGIHKDDFDFRLNDFLIRKIGSQGQNKTYLIALKMAQFDFFIQSGSSVPVLLLDDIFDKLDAQRVERIIKLVSQSRFGQIFITDTNRNYLDEILSESQSDYKLFRVENGQPVNI
jgi:recF protein